MSKDKRLIEYLWDWCDLGRLVLVCWLDFCIWRLPDEEFCVDHQSLFSKCDECIVMELEYQKPSLLNFLYCYVVGGDALVFWKLIV